MLFREISEGINNWYKNEEKTTLLVTGARQTGKTYIIREFLKEKAHSFVEFNLLENDAARFAIESSSNAQEFLLKLSALSKTPLEKGKTVIFIDEIQSALDIATKIKFLVEDGSFRYIMSGSLLGVELKNVTSLPVGYMHILYMYPMNFYEFCIANKVSAQILSYLKKQFESLQPVDETVHNQMLKLFNLYLIVGGLPAAVDAFVESNDIQKVNQVHEYLDQLYREDISKYDTEKNLLIKDIYDLIPSELNNPNKRFVLKNLNEKVRFYQFEESFVWLKDSGVGLFAYNVDEPVYPLLASKERTLFKLFLCDVGLLTFKLFDDSAIKILNGQVNVNFGSIYEAAVAQELTCRNFDLFYYNSKKNGEVDFITQEHEKVLPIEVKSGKDYKRHVALDNLLSCSYKIEKAYTLCNGNVEVKGKRIYLPIYMLTFLSNRKKSEQFIYKPDLSALVK